MKNKYSLIGLSLFVLVSCGQDVAYALDRTTYHTDVFADNMYQDTVLTSTLAPEYIASTTIYAVNQDNLIAGVANLKEADRMYNNAVINDDVFMKNNKLSQTLPELKYGFESKLFDGMLHCSDAIRVSKSRLQLQESGFGYVFPNTLTSGTFTGLYIKAGADTLSGGVYISDVKVSLSFYEPLDAINFAKHEFQMEIASVRRSDFPQFYGFYFDDVASGFSLDGVTAFSVTYDILDAAASASNPHYTALFVYEMVIAKSVWH